jgi:ankyrin repeat protein
VDIHTKNDKALRWVAQYDHLKIVRLLLEKGADVHADNPSQSDGLSRLAI